MHRYTEQDRAYKQYRRIQTDEQYMTDDIREQNRQNASGEQTTVPCPKCGERVKNAPKHIPACQGDQDD
ncbi:MAG: hypothetical protein HQRvContig01_26 [Haloquadratum phage sp.]|jgi:rubrerythrin|nr:MAG: hypothetical protein HQRvContig01_26 [Haloquadratum phage sp.]